MEAWRRMGKDTAAYQVTGRSSSGRSSPGLVDSLTYCHPDAVSVQPPSKKRRVGNQNKDNTEPGSQFTWLRPYRYGVLRRQVGIHSRERWPEKKKRGPAGDWRPWGDAQARQVARGIMRRQLSPHVPACPLQVGCTGDDLASPEHMWRVLSHSSHTCFCGLI